MASPIHVGRRVPKLDAAAKATGAVEYGHDMAIEPNLTLVDLTAGYIVPNLTNRGRIMRQFTEIPTAVAGETQALQAARDFAAVLARTPEFEAFDEAQWRLRNDGAAQAAIRAFQERQQSLRMMLMLGALSDTDRRDLQRLHAEMLAQPAVRAYAEAQERLTQVCQEIDRIISQDIGIDFAANCGTGCC